MAAEHNVYFGSICPKNTISCGATSRQRQYIGSLENALLNIITYDPGLPESTQDFTTT
jgi:hypothetical protein